MIRVCEKCGKFVECDYSKSCHAVAHCGPGAPPEVKVVPAPRLEEALAASQGCKVLLADALRARDEAEAERDRLASRLEVTDEMVEKVARAIQWAEEESGDLDVMARAALSAALGEPGDG